jgi:hypothetical protein
MKNNYPIAVLAGLVGFALEKSLTQSIAILIWHISSGQTITTYNKIKQQIKIHAKTKFDKDKSPIVGVVTF